MNEISTIVMVTRLCRSIHQKYLEQTNIVKHLFALQKISDYLDTQMEKYTALAKKPTLLSRYDRIYLRYKRHELWIKFDHLQKWRRHYSPDGVTAELTLLVKLKEQEGRNRGHTDPLQHQDFLDFIYTLTPLFKKEITLTVRDSLLYPNQPQTVKCYYNILGASEQWNVRMKNITALKQKGILIGQTEHSFSCDSNVFINDQHDPKTTQRLEYMYFA
jgi:hypothetical protein